MQEEPKACFLCTTTKNVWNRSNRKHTCPEVAECVRRCLSNISRSSNDALHLIQWNGLSYDDGELGGRVTAWMLVMCSWSDKCDREPRNNFPHSGHLARSEPVKKREEKKREGHKSEKKA